MINILISFAFASFLSLKFYSPYHCFVKEMRERKSVSEYYVPADGKVRVLISINTGGFVYVSSNTHIAKNKIIKL